MEEEFFTPYPKDSDEQLNSSPSSPLSKNLGKPVNDEGEDEKTTFYDVEDALFNVNIDPTSHASLSREDKGKGKMNVFMTQESATKLETQESPLLQANLVKKENFKKPSNSSHDDSILESPSDIISENAVKETMEQLNGLRKASKVSETGMTGMGPGRIRKYGNQDPSSAEWQQHKKHFFVLSSAGKPIYSRYGDESKLSTLMGLVQAIISFYQDTDDNIRCINAGDLKIVFMIRTPLYFLVASKTKEPENALRDQLQWLYNQIISIISHSQLTKIFEKQSNFDLRRLLGGTEAFLDHLCQTVGSYPSYILSAIHCLKMSNSLRQAVGSALQTAKTQLKEGLLYGMLIVRDRLITILRPKKHSFHPSDLHLIFNMVNSSTSFRSVPESWMPICLPKFNDKGFLHAYVSYITPSYPGPASDLCLVLVSPDRDKFFEMSQCKKMIVQHMTSSGSLFLLQEAIRKCEYKIEEIPAIPGILHFLYKSKPNIQYTMPIFTEFYSNDLKLQKRIFRTYQNIRSYMNQRTKNLKVYYQTGEMETFFGWSTSSFELYVTFRTPVTKSNASNSINNLLKWLKSQEDSIFITNAPVF